MTDVFISYSRKDSEFVHRLHDALHAIERDTWVDWQDIPLTAEWWDEIRRGIDAANNFIFVISPDSVTSPVCNNEVEYAVATHKRLIPVVRREVPPDQMHKALARHNWLYFRETDDFDKTFADLIDVLNVDLDYVRGHTRLLVRAREWEIRDRNDSYLLRGDDLNNAERWLAASGGKEPKPIELQTEYILASRRAASSRQRALLGGVSAALAVTAVLAVIAFLLFNEAENRRAESDMRGTAVAQGAATATHALGLSEIRGTEVAQQAATATNALGLSEVRGTAVAQGAATATHALGLSEIRGTQVAQQAATATNALGLSEQRGTEVAQGAATAVAAQATSERNAAESQSLALAASARQALDAQNGDLALALALQANTIPDPPLLARYSLIASAYAPGTQLVFEGHSNWVNATAVSADGRLMLSGGYDGNLILWDAQTGALLQQQNFGAALEQVGSTSVNLGAVYAIDFTPNPERTGNIALVGLADGSVLVWDVDNWTELRRMRTRLLTHAVAFSPDGALAASGHSGSNNNLLLWNVNTGAQIVTYEGHEDGVTEVEFSSDGQYLLTGSADATVRLWEVKTGETVQVFGPVEEADEADPDIRGVAFSADETQVIGGTNFGAVFIWDIETGEAARRIAVGDRSARVDDIALHPNGRVLAASTFDSIVYMLDVGDGQVIRRLVGHAAPVFQSAFAPDGQTLISASQDGTLRRWHVSGGAQIRALRGYNNNSGVASIAVSSDGRRALSGGSDADPAVLLWDLETGEVIQRLEGHGASVASVAFSPDERRALSGGWDGTVRLWDLETGEEIRAIDMEALVIPSVAFSPDGNAALVTKFGFEFANAGKIVYLLDLETGETLREYVGHTGPALAAVFSPDGSMILSGGGDEAAQGEAILWDMTTGEIIRRFTGAHTAAVDSLAFSADGSRAISGGQDFIGVLWDVATGTELRRFVGHSDVLRTIAYSPDESTILSASFDDTMRLWDVNTGDEILKLEGHSDDVTAAVYRPGAGTALSASRDGAIVEWQVALDPAAIIDWLPGQRYVRDLTCGERSQYRVPPLCET